MLIAQDKDRKRVNAESAVKSIKYYCPGCEKELILKQGSVRVSHFAHKTRCTDSWHYDMSDWHTNWQRRFPDCCQEIVKRMNNEHHRADVLIENCKTVIEFQHSPMTSDEFYERTVFYNKLGYKVEELLSNHPFLSIIASQFVSTLPRESGFDQRSISDKEES